MKTADSHSKLILVRLFLILRYNIFPLAHHRCFKFPRLSFIIYLFLLWLRMVLVLVVETTESEVVVVWVRSATTVLAPKWINYGLSVFSWYILEFDYPFIAGGKLRLGWLSFHEFAGTLWKIEWLLMVVLFFYWNWLLSLIFCFVFSWMYVFLLLMYFFVLFLNYFPKSLAGAIEWVDYFRNPPTLIQIIYFFCIINFVAPNFLHQSNLNQQHNNSIL